MILQMSAHFGYGRLTNPDLGGIINLIKMLVD
jgi:hypothetical protein